MSDPYNVKLRLLAAFRHLMVPLIRILLRNGIAFNELAEVVKSVYAHVAAKEFAVPGRRMSYSRVAIMTGLTRKEVARLFGEGDKLRKALDSNANRVARVLQAWHNDPQFMGPYGFPRDLSFEPEPGGGPCFADLVKRYSGDMPPRAMLDELLRVKATVEVEETGLIRVQKRTYIPEEFAPELIEVFARGVRRYVETVDHNIQEQDPARKRFERWVFPDYGIRQQDWQAFRDLVQDRLQEVIEDLDTRFAMFSRPPSGDAESVSVGVGLYLYRDDPEEDKLFADWLAEIDDTEDDVE